MGYHLKRIVAHEDFDFVLQNIADHTRHLDGDLKLGWVEEKQWCPSLQWRMPDGYEFKHKKVGLVVVTNPTVIRYETTMIRLILDVRRKIYFGGEMLGHPNSVLSTMQFGPKRSMRIPDDGALSQCHSVLSPDTLWVMLETPGFRFWGHWIVDHFPRLYLLYKMGLIHKVKFVFFEQPPKWSDIFFDVFSISKERIVVVDNNCLRADHLIIPAFFRETNHLFVEYTAESWHFLKRKLHDKQSNRSFISRLFNWNRHLKKVAKRTGKKKLRIYISRRNSKSILENEKAFERLLLRYDFFTFFPEDIDLPSTADFLEQADMVVGEDGSGMHNVIFCRRTCDVVVISSRASAAGDQLRQNMYQRVINANMFDRSWFYTPRFIDGKVSIDIYDFENYLKNVIDGS